MFRDWIFRNFQLGPRDNAVKLQVQQEMDAYHEMLAGATHRGAAGRPAHPDRPRRDRRRAGRHGAQEGLRRPDDHRRHRHHVECDRLGPVALRQHPDQRAALVAADNDDLLWTTATEEVLRYYAPVTMGRKVIEDTEVAGCPVHAGDQMLLTFPAANHDPEAFEDADQFQIDREKNRHVAFGLGIHRCLGSNLARLELTVALQEWLRAFPDYELDTTQETTWANGQIRGPRNIPVLLNR